MEAGMVTSALVGDAVGDAATDRAAFHALILDDPALPSLLGTIERPDDFVTAAIGIARRHGIVLPADAVSPDRKTPPTPLDRWPPPGWYPARSVATEHGLAIDWAWFGTPPLTDPFYEDSVRRHISRPFNRWFRPRTTLDTLIDGAPTPAVPDGLIFHMSRCGSTLVAQMLAAVARHRVVAEAAPIDAVVQWGARTAAPRRRQVAAVRAIVGAVGRKRAGERLFVKLDAWHACALPLFRAAFPTVPWIFLHRDPTEILASHRMRPGLLTVAGALPDHVLDLANDDAMPAAYARQALARIADAVHDHWHLGRGMTVGYADLPHAMVERIAPHFGFVPDVAESNAMLMRAARDAKSPDAAFVRAWRRG
jgi:hypothetical protein